MSLLRTLASSARLARGACAIAPQSGAWAMAGVRAAPQASGWARRAFATEAGFLDRGQVSDRVLEVVRKFEKVQPEKVTEQSHFVSDLGLDSLDAVELVMALEDEFAIEIADKDAEKIMSCEDAVTYLANNVNAQ